MRNTIKISSIASAMTLCLGAVACSSSTHTTVYDSDSGVTAPDGLNAETTNEVSLLGQTKLGQTKPKIQSAADTNTNPIRQTIQQKAQIHSEAHRIIPPSYSQSPQSPQSPQIVLESQFAQEYIASSQTSEKYAEIPSTSIVKVSDQPTSTFSIDVDTGAYSNVRRFLNAGSLPPVDSVRIEELMNYFSYSYDTPEDIETPFSISTELGNAPWSENLKLLHIGLKGFEVDNTERAAANLVFLLDVSGSMNQPNKLGLLKSSIKLLSKSLSEKDKVSIVVYAGASGVVLEPTDGNNHRAISKALESLSAGGSTNGEAGIKLAYSMAEKNLDPDGINRIILATDGDFNVGISNIKTLTRLIEKKRQSGIALSTLGFGTGNYNDHLMEQLADTGNGAYAYIDTFKEAQKVLAEELTATLLTIAKDVKIQIEFNPAVVSEYRLIGYVNRILANEDFNNDKVDAGEIGAGHTVTALYEIALHSDDSNRNSPLRYGNKIIDINNLGEIAELRLRYKKPDSDKSQLISRIIHSDDVIEQLDQTTDNYRFSAAVAGFGELLSNSKYLPDFGFPDALSLAEGSIGADSFGYRSEFVQLVKIAESLSDYEQPVSMR